MRARFCYAASVLAVSAVSLQAAVVYSSIPGLLPPNVASIGYETNQASEFGDLIQFAGTDRALKTVTLVMSDWAAASAYGSSAPNWSLPITLNLYGVNSSGANPAPGTLLSTQTQTFTIPWRPETSGGCPAGKWLSGGTCYSGIAFTISFNFFGVTLPGEIIYGVAYNTSDSGYSPIGAAGPYDLLNFGLADVSPAVGSNPFPDTAYWNTSLAGNYTDGGAGGVGVFRRDTNWTPYSGAVSFDAAPEPATFGLLASSLLGLAILKRNRPRASGW